jgi:hypothetical protein
MSPFSEAASYAATQESFWTLWTPKAYYRVHESPPLVPILSKTDPVHTTQSKTYRNIIPPRLRLRLSSGIFMAFSPKSYMHSSPFHAW